MWGRFAIEVSDKDGYGGRLVKKIYLAMLYGQYKLFRLMDCVHLFFASKWSLKPWGKK